MSCTQEDCSYPLDGLRALLPAGFTPNGLRLLHRFIGISKVAEGYQRGFRNGMKEFHEAVYKSYRQVEHNSKWRFSAPLLIERNDQLPRIRISPTIPRRTTNAQRPRKRGDGVRLARKQEHHNSVTNNNNIGEIQWRSGSKQSSQKMI